MEFAPTTILASALALGFRHGIDWDHIAAILDIVGTATSRADGDRQRGSVSAVLLSICYALGHAFIVVLLGLSALQFARVLPQWIDPIMERMVGATLVILGCYVFYSLFQASNGITDFKLRSRWMILFSMVETAINRLQGRHHSLPVKQTDGKNTYGVRTSFLVGIIHGIGAETGTQILLIAALGGAASHGYGVWMLLSFVLGLLASNTLVSILALTGFVSTRAVKPLYTLVGAIAGCFSLFVGIYFLCGGAESLDCMRSQLMGREQN